MLDEVIKNQKSALVILFAFTVFLFVTMEQYKADLEDQHDLERALMITLLFLNKGDELEIPADSDEENISLEELKINLPLVEAMAHINYALPLLFGQIFCPEGRVLSWTDWKVNIADEECKEKSVSERFASHTKYMYKYRNKIEEMPDSSEIQKLMAEKIRVPHRIDELVYGDADLVDIPLDHHIAQCVVNSTSKEGIWDFCNIEWSEIRDSTRLLNDQIKNGLSSLYMVVDVSGRNYDLMVTNQSYSKPNIDGEVFGSPSVFKIYPSWSSQSFTQEESLVFLGELYTKSTQVSYKNKDYSELVSWVENKKEELNSGVISLPILNVDVPVRWFLFSMALIIFGLILWNFYLLKLISKGEGLSPSVPWMLLVWSMVASASHSFKFISYFMLGTVFLLFRFLIIIIPGILLLIYAGLGSDLSSELFVGDWMKQFFVSSIAIGSILLSFLSVKEELAISIWIHKSANESLSRDLPQPKGENHES